MNALSVKNLKFKYSQSTAFAVNDVSFDIEKGSYTAIVGFNGSGKSSIARVICGLEYPTEGEVQIEKGLLLGMVFQSPKNQLVSGIINRDTAFGPQNLNLSKSEIELRTIESLNIVDMLDRANSSTSALSLGQTQKIALSGMIAIRPDILILDEAVSMMDPESRKDIFEFINYWHKMGNTIIQITHDMEVVQQAQRVIGIEAGKKFFDGTKEEFLADENNVFRINGKPLEICDKSLLNKNLDKEVTVSVRNLNFSYSEKATLENINFDLYKGTLTAITGPSGSGKSTIMELCTGLLKPETGSVIYTDTQPIIAQQNAQAALFEAFAADDVAFGPMNSGIHGKDLKTIVKDSMNLAGLPFDNFGERRTFSLSGGEQRRLSIAGILAMNRDIIFFDEPTAGLDSAARNQVMTMLRTLAESGKTVMFSTHHRDEADFSDREIHIEEGKLISDTVENLSSKKSDNLQPVTLSASEGMLSSLRNSSVGLSGVNQKNKSLLRNFHSVLKILLFLGLFSLSLCFQTFVLCSAALVVTVIYSIMCGFSFKQLVKSFLKILPFLLFFSVLQLIFHPAIENEVHYTCWRWFTITPSKLIFCLNSIIRTVCSIACLCGFFVSTPEYDLIDGLKILLKPLEIIRIPVRYFILILEIIFRFIPLLIEEANSIIKTQILRGGLGKVKGKMAKIKAILPLIVPMLIQTIKRSEALADAITMRCFK